MLPAQPCRISLILPCYNVEEYLERCIRSCLAQDIPVSDYEIILVDDGSTDNTAKVLMQWAKKSPNIRVIRQNNLGLGGARNTGLIHTQGAYIWFIDSDDWIAENCLSGLLHKAETEHLDLLYFHAKKLLPNDVTEDYGAQFFGGPRKISDCIVQNIALSACCSLYKKDFLISKELLFAEHLLHEDTDFNCRVISYDPKVFFLQEQYYFYDNRRINSITNSKEAQMQHDNLKILERYYSFSREVTIASPLKESIFRYLFMVCVVSNYPLQYHFTPVAKQMVKDYRKWIIATADQAKYLPASVIASSLRCSIMFFIFSLRFFQYIALLRRKTCRGFEK